MELNLTALPYGLRIIKEKTVIRYRYTAILMYKTIKVLHLGIIICKLKFKLPEDVVALPDLIGY